MDTAAERNLSEEGDYRPNVMSQLDVLESKMDSWKDNKNPDFMKPGDIGRMIEIFSSGKLDTVGPNSNQRIAEVLHRLSMRNREYFLEDHKPKFQDMFNKIAQKGDGADHHLLKTLTELGQRLGWRFKIEIEKEPEKAVS